MKCGETIFRYSPFALSYYCLLYTSSLWSVMPLYVEQAQDERLIQFIAHIEHWRTLSRRHGVADLL